MTWWCFTNCEISHILNYLEWVFKIRRKEENANSLLIGPKIRDISESGFGETMS